MVESTARPVPRAATPVRAMCAVARAYFTRFAGVRAEERNRPTWDSSPSFADLFFSFVGSFVGILAVACVHYLALLGDLEGSDLVGIVGSFGAHAVLVFAAPHSPLAQPYNAIVGNVVSAFVGVCVYKVVGASPASVRATAQPAIGEAAWPGAATLPGAAGLNWLAAALAVSLAITAMHCAGALHPPGGAMALIAVIGSDSVKRSGFWYVLMPGLAGSCIQVAIGIVVNNCQRGSEKRRYPRRWRPGVACCPPWKRRCGVRRASAVEAKAQAEPRAEPQAEPQAEPRVEGVEPALPQLAAAKAAV